MSNPTPPVRNADFSLKGRIQEATTYLFDLGSSMARRDEQMPGPSQRPIDLGVNYFKDRFGEKLVSNLKLIFTSIVLARQGYSEELNTSQFQKKFASTQQLIALSNVKLSDIKRTHLMQSLEPSSSYERCVIDSLEFAACALSADCGKKKVIKTLVVITDGGGEPKKLGSDIIDLLRSAQINLRILICGRKTKEEGSENTQFLKDKAANIKEYERICRLISSADCQAAIYEADTIVESLNRPLPSSKAARKLYSLSLTIGDADNYGLARTMSTPVNIYPCTRRLIRTTPKDSYIDNGKVSGVLRSYQYYIPKPKLNQAEEEEDESNEDASNDDYVGGGDIEKEFEPVRGESLIDGYLFGREIVTIESGAPVAHPVRPGFDIIGTVKLDYGLEESPDDGSYFYLPHWLLVSHVNYVVADPAENSGHSIREFMARIYALQADGMAYVARFAHSRATGDPEGSTRMDSPPQMVLLCPYIAGDGLLPGLLMVELPFAEDIQISYFPPFDLKALFEGPKKMSLSPIGEEEKPDEDANRDSTATAEKALELMRSVVSKMDLMTADIDDDNNPSEAVNILEIADPYDHRIKQALKHRALASTTDDSNNSGAIPPKLTVQTQYQHPPATILKASDDLDQLFELLEIKEITKQLNEAEKRRAEHDIYTENLRAKKANLDIDSLLD